VDGSSCNNFEFVEVIGVITKISSTNGYRNPVSSNSYEFIHGPKLPKQSFPKGPKLFNQL
jgi:hypothetical protein